MKVHFLPGRLMAGLLCSILCLLGSTANAAPVTTKFCVFDPLGAQGDFYNMIKDYQLAAKRWGVNLELKSYTDEGVAVEDFKAGQCDIIDMMGLRARLFNEFTGTIDSVGAVENYGQMRSLLEVLAGPKAEKYMVSGQYEVAGIIPIGAGYPFVADRSLNSLAKAAGKKIGVLEWDKTQFILVQTLGAQPVGSDVTNYGPKFNNGVVDAIIAPIILYKPFELYKGIGTKGGIIRRSAIQLTLQLMIRRDKFPPEFATQSRDYILKRVDQALGVIRNTENAVDAKHWMYVPSGELKAYRKIMREARVRLEKEGYYDKRMLGIMKRVRCKEDPEDAECSLSDE